MKIAYTINEACEAIGIGRTKLYQLIATGKVSPRKLGKRTLIEADELFQLVENLPHQRGMHNEQEK